MRILAIDQATVTGFAILGVDGTVLKSGSVSFKGGKDVLGESRGMVFLRFRKWLSKMMNEVCEDKALIVHEKTLMFGRITNTATADIAAGLKAIMEAEAAEKGWEITSVNPCTLKKWATGNGRADKQSMILAATSATGINPSDDNEADAILIGRWAAEKYGALAEEKQREVADAMTPPKQKPKKKTKPKH